MNNSKKKIFHIATLILILGIATHLDVFAQTKNNFSTKQFISPIDSFLTNRNPEKLYLQLDKPYYTVNDTLWLKAYLLQAGNLRPSVKSNILYIELSNDSNRIIKRFRLPVISGVSWGNIALNAPDITAGNYMLRAYTNWQRNFGENFVFKKSFSVYGLTTENWLVNSRAVSDKSVDGQQHVNVNLKLVKETDRQPVRLQDMVIKVKRNQKMLLKSAMQTDIEGLLKVDFAYSPAGGKEDLVIEATEKSPDNKHPHELLIPVVLNTGNTDLQFMPEGGKLVNGIPAYVGFKAIDGRGYGADVAGIIKNSKNEQVASFKSAFKGMGVFNFTPDAAEIYTAEITLPNGEKKTYVLPKTVSSGIVMNMAPQLRHADTNIRISITATPDILTTNTDYYLVGHTQGKVYFARKVTFSGKLISGTIPVTDFPTGVMCFTLFTGNHQPVCERPLFIDRGNHLQLNLQTNNKTYNKRDSIALSITVTNENGQPVRGNFSLAVTDDRQVTLPDTLARDNIYSHLSLGGDIKGDVEQPGYYFDSRGIRHIQELDNLLLTQGWTDYSWSDIFSRKPMLYDAEPDFIIKGSVTNGFKKGKTGLKVSLFSRNPLIFRDTTTDANGRFVFKQLPVVDSNRNYVVQTKNKNGSTFNMLINLDEWQPPVFMAGNQTAQPWYVNIDTVFTTLQHYGRMRYNGDRKLTGHILATVNITAKKIIRNSHNLNGPGEADITIDENELLKTPKKTLLDLLNEKVPGFGERYYRRSLEYMIHLQHIKFIFDGTDLDFFYNPYERTSIGNPQHEFIKSIFNQFLAADVKGVEVITSGKYIYRYDSEFLPNPFVWPNYDFIEITTRDGKGPFINQNPGVAVYRPLPFNFPKQFYRPKYAVKNNETASVDFRSTIHWEPNIITNGEGKATVSFYAADLPGTYTVIVEGTDLQGRLGSSRIKINIGGSL